MFIGIAPRSARKPECISAAAARARARSCDSAGQMPRSEKISCTRSAIASVSQVAKPAPGSPSQSTGTRPVGESFAIASVSQVAKPAPASPSQRTGTSPEGESLPIWSRQSCDSNFSIRSRNAMSRPRSSTHGRIDQEE